MIQNDVKRGPYQSVDEFVERAVRMLHDQEEWLSENRNEIATKIQHAFDQAQPGELVDADQAVRLLRQRRVRTKPG